MGNCVFKPLGVIEVEETVKVVTTNGGVMELYAPITAESITNEFPGHAIYLSPDTLSLPLLHNENLHAGQLYYLLPLKNINSVTRVASSSNMTPYRMSIDNQRIVKKSSVKDEGIVPRHNGVWKVKLVISPEQLAEILAQETRTEELIESVRTVAKCGKNNMGASSSSLANSDQWSSVSSCYREG